jgi:transposase
MSYSAFVKKQTKLNQKQTDELQVLIEGRDTPGPVVRRAQAVLMVNGETDAFTVKALTGFSRKHSFTLRANYLKAGIETLQDRRRRGPKEMLSIKQRNEVADILRNKKPTDHGYKSLYWTTGILGHFIERRYGVKYKSKTSYYLLFRKAEFTYHKPGRVYEKRDEGEVEKWKGETKPKIEKAMREENTVILTEDEMILSTQTTFQKIWLPKGEYPKIEVSNTRKNRSVYGFLNIKTGREHAFKTERQNMHETVKILKKLRKFYPDRNLLLVWDGAGWHRGSEVQKWIEKDKNTQTLYFPRYSPEENPQEHVWKKGRSQITHNHFIKDIDKATDEFVKYLNSTKFPYKLLDCGAIS